MPKKNTKSFSNTGKNPQGNDTIKTPNILHFFSNVAPSLFHHSSIDSPSKRWTIDGLSMDYRWIIDGVT